MNKTTTMIIIALLSTLISSCENQEKTPAFIQKDSITTTFALGPAMTSIEVSEARIQTKITEIKKDSVTVEVYRGFSDNECKAFIYLRKPKSFNKKIGDMLVVKGRMWSGGYGAGWSYFIE